MHRRPLQLWWLLLALLKFLLGLWLRRRPNVMDNLLRIVFRVGKREDGARC